MLVRATVLALLVLAPTTSAAAPGVRVEAEFVDEGYVGNEPNVDRPGRLPYDTSGSPSATYPADANGLYEARTGEGAVDVLSVEWVHRACAPGAVCAAAASEGLLYRDLRERMLVPGAGQFHAWLGRFTDVDGDGFIRPGNGRHESAHVATRGCSPAASTADEDGLGAAFGASTGASVRCAREEEWVGRRASIVAYVTPGEWGAGALDRPARAWTPFDAPRGAAAERPDLAFAYVGEPGRASGRYVAPSSNLDLATPDGSLLSAVVVEAISEPVAVFGGDRTHEAGYASLVDVDLHTALDRGLEALFATTVGAETAGWGCDRARPEAGCPAATEPFARPFVEARSGAAAAAGPALARVLPAWERDPQPGDRSFPRGYLDVVTRVASVPLVVGAYDAEPVASRVLPAGTGNAAPAADGRTRTVPAMTVAARLGVWQDRDGDGWIGSPVPAPGCPDVHDCGGRPDPHAYDDARGEFLALCGARDLGATAPGADGVLRATLRSQTGTWGAGVYVLSDRTRGGEGDPLAEDGRAGYDPYDDAVVAPGRGLVFSGPIEATLTCSNDAPGLYRSYERFVFAGGTNAHYAVQVEASTTLRHGWTEETVSDVDVLGP